MSTTATKSKLTGFAGHVMGMSEPRLQQPVPGGTPLVQRQSEAAAADQADQDVPRAVNQALNSPGQPLDAATLAFFEPHFGHDFGKVRIHADGRAAESARAIRARAFTLGSDVFLDRGYYFPDSREGRRLLAHELTHVLQQEGSNESRAAVGILGSPQKQAITSLRSPDGLVQRSGVLEVSTSEGFLPPAPTQQATSLGLAEPDCRTHVDDVF